MFWDKSYAPSANIEALLEKEGSTLEEFLDEEDILQECKTQKKNLVNYITRPDVIRRLVELITTEPAEDLPIAQRFRYANMSCEILTLGLPSLDEKLLSDADTLQLLYSYLEKEPPLNPLLSSFFSKTFSMLFTKKPEQDWFLYQHMCLQLLEYIKSQKTFLDFICKHFDTPVIPDLIMQMMKDIDGGQLKRNLYEWLTEDKIVERLIAVMRNPQETDKHANVADFFCDLIHQGRLMRQTEQENDSFEPAFEGSNPILRTIESAQTIEALLNVILEPNALESAILSGISVVLTLITPITFTDEPNSDRQRMLQKREHEFHQEVQETVITVIAPRLHEFLRVLKNPPAKPSLETTAAVLSPPFGKTRLQVCRVFTALLETKHETIQQAICATDYFALLLNYFKEYCWNNFLHSELEKAMNLVFYNGLSNNNTTSTECTDIFHDDYIFDSTMKAKVGEFDKDEAMFANDRPPSGNEFEAAVAQQEAVAAAAAAAAVPEVAAASETEAAATSTMQQENHIDSDAAEKAVPVTNAAAPATAAAAPAAPATTVDVDAELKATTDTTQPTLNDLDKTKTPNNHPPTEMQTYLIVNCQLVSKLVNYWRHNAEAQSAEKGRRLGYMGHLIKILRHITNCISESEHIAALITTSFANESDLQLWQSLIDADKGEFTLAIAQQNKLLANCNPHEEYEYSVGNSIGDTNSWDTGAQSYSNVCYSDLDNTLQDIVFSMDNDQNQFEFGSNIDDDDDNDDEHHQQQHGGSSGDGLGHGMFTKNSTTLNNLAADPWDMDVQFADITVGVADANIVNTGTGSWGTEFNSDNFADFDAHFSTFDSDLGMPHTRPTAAQQHQQQPPLAAPTTNSDEEEEEHVQEAHNEEEEEGDVSMTATTTTNNPQQTPNNATTSTTKDHEDQQQAAEYDNNANVEKAAKADIVATPVATSIVSRLQSVLLDGEDDYEDDEGMWTKPLGGNNQLPMATDQQQQQQHQPAPISNGPSKGNEFNHANNDNISDDRGDSNITTGSEQLAEQQQKKSESIAATATNNAEIATTTT
ncbi:serine/threonine-protein phosphatase 6 regulatory subunit 3 [Drosophila grimshawi]|uniref:GH15642 n=1 Tax=Drosophila grimshawi TaxID=7222 RepID=B4J081_DROGR|nr:serine/threonine-protein phosphatase 6 regulatory subunit 3 [Drosophila grimshawi]EDV95682.1 GH15642 [Drosophila grimshawi]